MPFPASWKRAIPRLSGSFSYQVTATAPRERLQAFFPGHEKTH